MHGGAAGRPLRSGTQGYSSTTTGEAVARSFPYSTASEANAPRGTFPDAGPGRRSGPSNDRFVNQPVMRLETRPHLPAQDRQFVSQHKDLQLLRPIATRQQHQQREQPAGDEVPERHKQRRPPKDGETPTPRPGQAADSATG